MQATVIAAAILLAALIIAAGSEWVHEIKHDGYRLMARRDPIGIRLITRNGNDWSPRCPLIVEAVNRLNARSCLVDGEAGCLSFKSAAKALMVCPLSAIHVHRRHNGLLTHICAVCLPRKPDGSHPHGSVLACSHCARVANGPTSKRSGGCPTCAPSVNSSTTRKYFVIFLLRTSRSPHSPPFSHSRWVSRCLLVPCGCARA